MIEQPHEFEALPCGRMISARKAGFQIKKAICDMCIFQEVTESLFSLQYQQT